MEKTDQEVKPPVIELDEMQVLRDQVASLSMKLAQSEQISARHQAISNQLAKQLSEARQELERIKNPAPKET